MIMELAPIPSLDDRDLGNDFEAKATQMAASVRPLEAASKQFQVVMGLANLAVAG